MIRALETRLTKLEAADGGGDEWRACHRVIGSSDECSGKIAELIAGGQAQESDLFICRIIVTPHNAGAQCNGHS